jgi:D-xylose transport system ATP-binding protein
MEATVMTQVEAPPALEAHGIVKTYGAVLAVDGADIVLRSGQITALVGNNGAGKSTLAKVLCGATMPDEGTIVVGGQQVRFRNPHQARQLGIRTVFQDLALVEQRDVAHNLFLGSEPTRLRFFVNRRQMDHEATAALSSLGVDVPSINAQVRYLSGGQRQSIAVARVSRAGGQIILLDEPTAALGVREAARVIDLMVRLRAAGHALLLISHNIERDFDLADQIVVMRRGRTVAATRASDTTKHEVVGMLMSGGSVR